LREFWKSALDDVWVSERERGSNRKIANIAQWGLRNIYSSQNIAWIIKSRRMRWADQVVVVVVVVVVVIIIIIISFKNT